MRLLERPFLKTAIESRSKNVKIAPNRLLSIGLLLVTFGLGSAGLLAEEVQGASAVHSLWDSNIHVPAFDLPLSGFLSSETRGVLAKLTELELGGKYKDDERRFYSDYILKFRARYKVTVQAGKTGGVSTTIITPADGVSAVNRHRVLINVPGPDSTAVGRGQLESAPIAALGKIKIVSVNFRTVPERPFPAASEEVVAVYKALLEHYKPDDIGIYGCSEGRMEELVEFEKEGLPMPGAIGILSAPPLRTDSKGDSEYLVSAFTRAPIPGAPRNGSYFGRMDPKDPSVFAGLTSKQMARFPSTLLITGTRDATMSSLVAAHSHLVSLGVKADLHVWEGMPHGFFFESDLPESREVYDVVVRFFREHLGGK
jgi:monoterpene epsilon-lactone hydrolase